MGATSKVTKVDGFSWYPNELVNYDCLTELVNTDLIQECLLEDIKMQKIVILKWRAAEHRDAKCQMLYQHLRETSTAMSMASSPDSNIVNTATVRTKTVKPFTVPTGIIVY